MSKCGLAQDVPATAEDGDGLFWRTLPASWIALPSAANASTMATTISLTAPRAVTTTGTTSWPRKLNASPTAGRTFLPDIGSSAAFSGGSTSLTIQLMTAPTLGMTSLARNWRAEATVGRTLMLIQLKASRRSSVSPVSQYRLECCCSGGMTLMLIQLKPSRVPGSHRSRCALTPALCTAGRTLMENHAKAACLSDSPCTAPSLITTAPNLSSRETMTGSATSSSLSIASPNLTPRASICAPICACRNAVVWVVSSQAAPKPSTPAVTASVLALGYPCSRSGSGSRQTAYHQRHRR